MGQEVTHPIFGYKISYRRLLEVQARLLSRHLLGGLTGFPIFHYAPSMKEEHLFVTYDIGDQKCWRRVFNVMNGYGEWLQLSVLQCRLSRQRHAELVALLDGMIHHDQDHVLFVDVGLADQVTPRVVSLGKTSSRSSVSLSSSDFCRSSRVL